MITTVPQPATRSRVLDSNPPHRGLNNDQVDEGATISDAAKEAPEPTPALQVAASLRRRDVPISKSEARLVTLLGFLTLLCFVLAAVVWWKLLT